MSLKAGRYGLNRDWVTRTGNLVTSKIASVIPIATATVAGLVKPKAKTTAMTKDVGVSSAGLLYTAPELPTYTSSEAEKALKVNSDGTGVEWGSVGGGMGTLMWTNDSPTSSLTGITITLTGIAVGDIYDVYYTPYTSSSKKHLQVARIYIDNLTGSSGWVEGSMSVTFWSSASTLVTESRKMYLDSSNNLYFGACYAATLTSSGVTIATANNHMVPIYIYKVN